MRSRLFAVCAVIVLLPGCAPAAPGQPGAAAQLAPPRAQKTLVIAENREPAHIEGFTGAGGAGGAGTILNIVHNNLARENENEVYIPELAVELPSVEKGTWRLNPDGSMDTTWRIHSNLKWHDGTPFSSADLLFTFTLRKDPALPSPRGAEGAQLMESAIAPDPHTLVIHWSKTYNRAGESSGLNPLPRHLLEELYLADKEAFVNSRYFQEEFIGLGPYRLVRWERGAHMEFAPFEDYYRGRPPLDRVIFRFVFDPNTLIANILAGAVDIVLPPSVDLQTALEVKQRWEGTGNVARFDSVNRLRHLEVQHRPEAARPANGLTNVSVRQAFYHAINRPAFVEVITQGMAAAADSWIPPNHALRSVVEGHVPQFPHDPGRAQQLLASVGWARGPDGILVHGPSGERFEVQLRADQGAGKEKEVTIIGEDWKAIGANATIDIIPSAREGDREYESLSPGVLLTGNLAPRNWFTDRTNSRNISSAANRWTGRNRTGYVNPRVDGILEKLEAAIDPREQAPLHQELMREQMADVAIMPLYWEVQPVFMLRGVKEGVVGARMTYRFWEWDKG